ncbi:MAG: zinc ribbon domain-containing protein [Candidatus Sulfotelmatobacter sp.]
MTIGNQTSTRSKDEIHILAPWSYYLFTAVFVTISVLFVTIVGRDTHAPRFPVRCLLGLLCGAVLGCYAVLIGYINQDAGRRSMSRLLWTLVAIFVPNGLGILLYFVLRKPLAVHCPQCGAEVEPGFSFCPRCSNRLKPVCPHCQRSIDLGDKFCPYCGGALEPAAGAPHAAPTAIQP